MIERRHFTRLLLAAPFAATACSVGTAERPVADRGGFSFCPGLRPASRSSRRRGGQLGWRSRINPGVQVIDLAGPWETFQDTLATPDAAASAFELFTVSETPRPFRASGGLMVVPDFTIHDAPVPDIVVVPHFDLPNPRTHEAAAIHHWIRETHDRAALTMSICTGAFQLAKTGLLDGIPMATNQKAYDNFAKAFPTIDLRRGPRFVESGRIATAGGLSAGIDLALRVVARYFGDGVAQATADTMEYAGTGWRT
ncbi:MAG: DJ-1/PfpI family protein [Sphingomonas bacterium]|nr:DJ-1/PfpI family protein [Sphingomonas bacterium]